MADLIEELEYLKNLIELENKDVDKGKDEDKGKRFICNIISGDMRTRSHLQVVNKNKEAQRIFALGNGLYSLIEVPQGSSPSEIISCLKY